VFLLSDGRGHHAKWLLCVNLALAFDAREFSFRPYSNLSFGDITPIAWR
jgi:hypothetical protein